MNTRLLFVLCLSIIVQSTNAQRTETELLRSAWKLEKKALVADFMKLTDSDGEKFWPIYNKYEEERNAFGTRRIKLIENYMAKYETMDEKTMEELVKESTAIQRKELSLREKYYAIMKKSVSITVAARFYQIEDAINVTIRAELYDQLPLYEK